MNYILWPGYSAMCIWPFLLVKQDVDLEKNPGILIHEGIHARQQQEMLWLFFFLWYILEYLLRLMQYHKHRQAYHAISFEKEAFENERVPDYLAGRRPLAWMRYL